MNSMKTIDDLTRDHFADEATKCIKNFFARNQNISTLQKELLEVNLSITAYIEESKRRLEALRLGLAHEAKSTEKVVEILSEKQTAMSQSPITPRKRNPRLNFKSISEDNNNTCSKYSERHQAKTFIQWFKLMIDNERKNLSLYLSDDAILDWFGRTIKSRKKVATFLNYDMQFSRHNFTSVESIEKIQIRHNRLSRKDGTVLASPLHSPEIIKSKDRSGKRRLRSNCNSPEWADGCDPDQVTGRKHLKTNADSVETEIKSDFNKREYSGDDLLPNHNKGDGILGRCGKRNCATVTPPNCEVGQGDCLPSTSGMDSNKSHETLNSQLPKLAVECNGYIEFTRTRNNRSTDAMKWERKCKVQISYSEDPLNIGEYIIWKLCYTDESKCRRNLLSAFEEVAKESMK